MSDYSLEIKMELYNELNATKVEVTLSFVREFLTRFVKKFNYTSIDLEMLISKIILGSPKEVNMNTFIIS